MGDSVGIAFNVFEEHNVSLIYANANDLIGILRPRCIKRRRSNGSRYSKRKLFPGEPVVAVRIAD